MGTGDDKGGLFVGRKIAGAAGRADDREPAGHGLGGCVGPAGAPFGTDEHIGLGKEPGHPFLGKVEIELVGYGCLDQKAGVASISADQAVEKYKTEARPVLVESLHRPDHFLNPLSFLGDAAVTEDLEFNSRRSASWEGKKDLRVDPPGSTVTAEAIFPLDPTADARRIPQQVIPAPGGLFFPLMAFENKVETFCSCLEGIELIQDGIFAAKADIEFHLRESCKRPNLGAVFQPVWLLPCRSEKGEAMTSPGEGVSDLEITTDPAENFNVGKESRDPHPR